MPEPELGPRIARARRRRGLSQAVLAGLIGRSESWLSQVERGKRGLDSHSVLVRLAEVLRVDIEGPPDYDDSSARRDHQASAAVIALSASRMSPPTSPAVAAQCRGIRARAPGSQRCSSRVNGSGAVPS